MNEENKALNVLAADSLLELAKEHKKNCTGECCISLFSLREPYKQLRGRDYLLPSEVSIFI